MATIAMMTFSFFIADSLVAKIAGPTAGCGAGRNL
jgi:hypothetical protein